MDLLLFLLAFIAATLVGFIAGKREATARHAQQTTCRQHTSMRTHCESLWTEGGK